MPSIKTEEEKGRERRSQGETSFVRLVWLSVASPAGGRGSSRDTRSHFPCPPRSPPRGARALPKLASILPTAHSRPTSPLYPPPPALAAPGAPSASGHLQQHHDQFPAASASSTSRPPSPSFSSAHSASPSQDADAFDLATSSRRRPVKRASTMGNSSSPLPHYVEPDTPMIGNTGRHPRRPGGAGGGAGGGGPVPVWKRPRVVGTLLFVALVVLLVIPDGNRARTHGALTKAGVNLPDELPERLQGFLDYINWDDGRNDLRYVPPPPPPIEDEDMGLPEEDLDSPHKLEPNGHLLVAPLSTFKEPPKPHPIFTLIKRAEQDWNRKVHRQSKTLKDAVHEYRKRYKRNPPRGFDKWWAYAKANRVILVDEYDQIHRDLEPFWALCVLASSLRSALSITRPDLTRLSPLAASRKTSRTASTSCRSVKRRSRSRSRRVRLPRWASRRSCVAPRTWATSSGASPTTCPTSTSPSRATTSLRASSTTTTATAWSSSRNWATVRPCLPASLARASLFPTRLTCSPYPPVRSLGTVRLPARQRPEPVQLGHRLPTVVASAAARAEDPRRGLRGGGRGAQG